jgi:7 transmembrane sweet-taste receptor of 3 GCPR
LAQLRFSLAKLFVCYGIVLLAPVLLAARSGVERVDAKLHEPDPLRPSENFTTCAANTTGAVFAALLLGYCGTLLVGSLVVSLKTWKIDSAVLNEGVWLGLSSYTLLLAYAVAIAIVASDSVSLSVNYIIRSSALLIGNCCTAALLFAPKAVAVRKRKQFDHSGRDGASAPSSLSRTLRLHSHSPSPNAMFIASSTLDVGRHSPVTPLTIG